MADSILSFWLILLSMINSSHVIPNGIILFFFYGWKLFLCVHTYHIFFIHSCVDDHLGYFHVLAIVNSAASKHRGAHIFLNYNLSECMLRRGVVDHMVVLFLVFWGTPILFSTVAISSHIPTNSLEGFLFPQTQRGISNALSSYTLGSLITQPSLPIFTYIFSYSTP